MIKGDFNDVTLPREKLSGIYRGVVEDNNDPKLAGRCRIRVFGIHTSEKRKTNNTGIPTNELPWAEPACGLLEGSISGLGLFSIPLQGSHVFVFFENGNPMYPRFFATAPGIPTVKPNSNSGFADPSGTYPLDAELGNPDWNKGDGTYPHNIVLKTHGGHIIEIDSTSGAKKYKIYHPSGTITEIDDAGNIDITIIGNETKNININRETTISGNDKLSISGNFDITVGGNCNLTASGNVVIKGATILLN